MFTRGSSSRVGMTRVPPRLAEGIHGGESRRCPFGADKPASCLVLPCHGPPQRRKLALRRRRMVSVVAIVGRLQRTDAFKEQTPSKNNGDFQNRHRAGRPVRHAFGLRGTPRGWSRRAPVPHDEPAGITAKDYGAPRGAAPLTLVRNISRRTPA